MFPEDNVPCPSGRRGWQAGNEAVGLQRCPVRAPPANGRAVESASSDAALGRRSMAVKGRPPHIKNGG